MIATFGEPVTLPWPYILDFSSGSATITVDTFNDLPETGELYQQIYVLDNGINSTASGVIWTGSAWVITSTSVSGVLQLPFTNEFNASPQVTALTQFSAIFCDSSTIARWNGSTSAWQLFVSPITVDAFGDLNNSAQSDQVVTVLDNGFRATATVKYSNSLVSWYVESTTVDAAIELPADGVWSASPSVESVADVTLVRKSDFTQIWLWDGATWASFT